MKDDEGIDTFWNIINKINKSVNQFILMLRRNIILPKLELLKRYTSSSLADRSILERRAILHQGSHSTPPTQTRRNTEILGVRNLGDRFAAKGGISLHNHTTDDVEKRFSNYIDDGFIYMHR